MKPTTTLCQPFNARLKTVASLSSAPTSWHGTWNDSKLIYTPLRPCANFSRHNMPSAEASAFRNQYRQGSASEASSPSRGSISAASMPQQVPASAPSLPQPSGTMSIGSIIEPNMHRSSYESQSGGPNLHDLSHAPIGTAPRSLPPELLYGLTPSGESPLYSSSDSCYSPLSDYLQPQAVTQQYYPHEVIQRPESASLESWSQPIIQQSPLSAGALPPTWSEYDPSEMAFGPERACLPPVSIPFSRISFPRYSH